MMRAAPTSAPPVAAEAHECAGMNVNVLSIVAVPGVMFDGAGDDEHAATVRTSRLPARIDPIPVS
jgi:hypothetical protein